MKGKVLSNLSAVALIMTFIGLTASALAQDKPADNMEIVKEKVHADKKLFIATNMELTESEAKAFWPVYEAYQAELGKLRERDSNLIDEFAGNIHGDLRSQGGQRSSSGNITIFVRIVGQRG